MTETRIMSADTVLTPVSDRAGHEVVICAPSWFDTRQSYAITNAPARTADLRFTGSDLNFAARVLYAEASGSAQLQDKAERDKEKEAILNVKHFRLNRRRYPTNAYIATTFRMVCEAPNQFESVYKNSTKFLAANESSAESLAKRECADFEEALLAIKAFLAKGPNADYQYDNFRGYLANGQGTHIGRSRFWLSAAGKEMMNKTP